MKEQLEKLMRAEGLTPAKFADEIGVQRSSISHIISGRNKPSYDFIMKIVERFHGINTDWLLTGKGSMIKGQDPLISSSSDLFDPHTHGEESRIQKDLSQTSETGSENDANRSITIESSNETKKSDKKYTDVKITNVNEAKYILVFYKDGTYEQFNARD